MQPLGLIFALFGVTMTLITGNGLWDAAGTAMIGVLLVIIAVVLALETKSLLLGESATVSDGRAVEAAIGSDGTRIIHLKTLHLGPEAINAAEQRIRSAVPIARIIYLEPDVYAPRTEQVPADSSGPANH